MIWRESLEPKVQGSIPCASTSMLCHGVSGCLSQVPDVSHSGYFRLYMPGGTAQDHADLARVVDSIAFLP